MQSTETSAGDNSVLSYTAIGFAVLMVLLSQFLFKTMLSRIDLSSPVKSKFANYVSAFIVRAALVEGSTLLNIVVVLLSGSYLNMGVAVVLLLILISLRPQKAKVIEDLKIYYPDVLD
ncbi:hypothetical protein KHS38_13670 [Mucilaginibacter sp. Bleaf8]|uniref:hypothetical protein n=1 Tax=Mucilaginibacter sp. Bleaf8 TaxID=2834430 RepID=UPI001BCB46FA|nr:hypothetical protein [Mucilaginibacter sp. Bleaf8]MBS7565455.1 hypothetical protein [Mucilaginibacter sp. Bleaf8]